MKAVEIGTLIIAVIALVFTGVQTLLLRQTIEATYLSNLQSRQIDTCAEVIEAAGAAQAAALIDFIQGAPPEAAPSAAARAELTAKLDKLAIYSGKETQQQIARLRSLLPDKAWFFRMGYPETSGEALGDLEQAFAPIRARCAAVMLGEDAGLL